MWGVSSLSFKMLLPGRLKKPNKSTQYYMACKVIFFWDLVFLFTCIQVYPERYDAYTYKDYICTPVILNTRFDC